MEDPLGGEAALVQERVRPRTQPLSPIGDASVTPAAVGQR
jgi:hypothetical protein